VDPIGASLANSTVAQLWTLHLHGANPGLNLALRPMAVPDYALAPVRQSFAFHRRQERVSFRLNGLGQQPARAASQDRRQRIIDRIGLTERNNSGSACHRRIAPSGGSGRLPPTSICRRSHSAITHFPA